MANTLLDSIKQRLAAPGQQASPTAAPAGIDNQQTVQSLLRARSGKEVAPSSGPRASAVGEQMANFQTGLGMQQLQQEGKLQAQQLAGQEAAMETDTELQGKAMDEKRLDVQQDFNQRMESFVNEYSRGNKQLDLQKDAAKAEQAGFVMRLGRDGYINNLQNEGKRARLDNGLKFQEELNRSIFAEEQDLFNNDINFRSAMNKSNREFIQDMAGMDIDFALSVAAAENRAANQQMIYSGASTMISAGAQAAGSAGAASSGSPSGAGIDASNVPPGSMEA